jgi:CRP-like cAMP-binding protein
MRDVQSGMLHRIMRLRQFPIFADADLDELATVAENVTPTTIPPGCIVVEAGQRPESIHLVLDGTLRGPPGSIGWGPRHVFGALETFANRPVLTTVVADTEVHTLRLAAHEVGDLLEDNFKVLIATVRELARQLLARGHSPSPAVMSPVQMHRIGLVERLILLRQLLPYCAARLQALATLARASEELTLPAKSELVLAGTHAEYGVVVIEGSIAVHDGASTRVLGPGAHVGHLEALAAAPFTAGVESLTQVRVLRSEAATMLDVLEDHTDMGVAMIATFANALLSTSPDVN